MTIYHAVKNFYLFSFVSAAVRSVVCTIVVIASLNNLAIAEEQALEVPIAEQIEDLKKALIGLNRDLFILEEDLLFPSSTQVAVYLALDVGTYFGLDSVELLIDDELATHYLYTERQVNALERGGVQRLYLGNLSQGKHQLTAFFVGIGPEDRPYKRAVSLTFDKSEDPQAIELKISDSTSKHQPEFTASVL